MLLDGSRGGREGEGAVNLEDRDSAGTAAHEGSGHRAGCVLHVAISNRAHRLRLCALKRNGPDYSGPIGISRTECDYFFFFGAFFLAAFFFVAFFID